MTLSLNSYYLVADGACRKNPGPGGYGLIVATPDGQVIEFGGHDSQTTNNRMELMGFYRGLQEIFKLVKSADASSAPHLKTIHVICDSKYVLDGAAKNVHQWSKNGWQLASGGEVKNQDLWEKILKGLNEFKALDFKFEYELVKGHSGNDANERVDQIAVRFSHEEPIDLYRGSLSAYPIKLTGGAKESFQAVYLSYVDGKLLRHKTWDECQKATHGKKGAKFKKVTNRLQEQDALESWGIKQST